jgi:hypothetical protein
VSCSEMLGVTTFSIVQRFGNWICFRPQGHLLCSVPWKELTSTTGPCVMFTFAIFITPTIITFEVN